MTSIGLGDLSQQFQMRTQNMLLKQRLQVTSEQVTTGVAADPARHLNGATAPLATITREIAQINAYGVATAEAASALSFVQTSLDTVNQTANEAVESLLLAGVSPDQTLQTNAAADALNRLDQVISTLNVEFGGRSLFSGAAVDRPALAAASDWFGDIQTAVSGATSVQDVLDTVDAWFDTPGGGFDTLAHLGSDSPASKFFIAEGTAVSGPPSVTDPAIKEVLKGLVLGAVLSDDALLSGVEGARDQLAQTAGTSLLGAVDLLTGLQSNIGINEENIASVQVQHQTNLNALEIAHNELIAVDPYEQATLLESTQTQLETLYTITARLSRLNLADYL